MVLACPLLHAADGSHAESPIGYVLPQAERVGGGLGNSSPGHSSHHGLLCCTQFHHMVRFIQTVFKQILHIITN